MEIRNVFLGAIAMLCITGTCYAENTTDELTRLSNETAILKARKAKADIELSVLQTEAEIKQRRNGAGLDSPVLKRIEGVNGKLAATIEFEPGVVKEGCKNEVIYDGWKIVSITSSTVRMARRKEEIELTFGSGNGTNSNRDGRFTGTAGSIPLPQ